MTSTAPSMLPGVSSWGQAGARHRHFSPCWENRERLSCPLPVLWLQLLDLSAASPQAGAGTWDRGGQGLAEGPSELVQGRGGCGSIVGCLQEHRPRAPGCSSLSQGSIELGDSLPCPVVTFSAPKRKDTHWTHHRGWCQVPTCKDGWCRPREAGLQPRTHKGPRLRFGDARTQQFPQATGMSGEISVLGLDLPSRGGAVRP